MSTVAPAQNRSGRAASSTSSLIDRTPTHAAPRPLLTALAGYTSVAMLSSLALVCVMQLWRADLTVPFCTKPDALLMQTWMKGIWEHGWYLHNESLGAPGGMFMHDFPMADNLHFLLLKFLIAATHDWAVAFNLYYLLGFPAAAVTAAATMRSLGISWPSAAVASVLYSLLPYHFERESHLFLAAYYLVPPVILTVLWVYFDQLAWPWSKSNFIGSGRRRFYFSVLILLAASAAGVYYAFFTCCLLLIAGGAAALGARALRPLLIAGALITVTAIGVAANISPSLLYWRQHGKNPEVAHRLVEDTEYLSLKIGQLLLPAPQHRLPPLKRLREKYDALVLSGGEKKGSALGLVGSCGFLFLLGVLLSRRTTERGQLCEGLAMLNVFSVLLATIGGFGSMFSLLVSPSIRAYNRLSIFIALFALMAVALLLDRLFHWWIAKGGRAWPVFAVLAALLVGGVLDQTSSEHVPDYAGLAAEFHGDADFVARIEQHLETGAMVYQFPYYPFPEFPCVHKVRDYHLFRPYLHSRWLRWGHGVMKGRPDDVWQRKVAAMPVNEQVHEIVRRGFRGITIDRFGYGDDAVGLEAAIASLVGPPAAVSADQRMSFFLLR